MNKSEIVSKYLEDNMIKGDLKPGDKIPSELKLAEKLGVSRVSVRSGIEKLNAVGLLDKKKGGGTFVSKFHANDYLTHFLPTMMFDEIDYLEMLEFRSALDSLSIELCINHLKDDIINQLKQNISKMKLNMKSEDFFEIDKEFHLIISKESKNTLIHNVNLLIWDVLEKHAKQQYNVIDNEKRLIEHQLIFDTIVNQDIELAKIYTNRHLYRTISDIRKTM